MHKIIVSIFMCSIVLYSFGMNKIHSKGDFSLVLQEYLLKNKVERADDVTLVHNLMDQNSNVDESSTLSENEADARPEVVSISIITKLNYKKGYRNNVYCDDIRVKTDMDSAQPSIRRPDRNVLGDNGRSNKSTYDLRPKINKPSKYYDLFH